MSDPDATQTFTPTEDPGPDPARRVRLLEPGAIEARMLGEDRPAVFEDHFPRIGRLGAGGMGEVHLARDLVLGREVAVKALHDRLATQPRVLRRFLREAQVTAQLEHPGIVPCHALECTSDGAPAFVMKHLEGETLKEYMSRCVAAWGTDAWSHEEFGLKARVELFLKVCDAIAYAHDRGVLHRDIKPANVMRGDFNVVYVMDWGIARLLDEGRGEEPDELEFLVDPDETPETRTATGTMVGTPLYMSPEQVNSPSDELTAASDQYALGLLLRFLLTGEPGRKGGDVVSVIERAGRGQLEPFPRTGPARAVPRELRAIADLATRPNPGLRYASVAELAADLRRFLHGEEVRAHPDSLLRAAWRKVAQHPTLTLAIVFGIVSTAGATTTWSLLTQLAEREVAEERTARLTRLVSKVTHHVQGLDRRLAQTEEALTRIAVDVERRVDWGAPGAGTWIESGDLARVGEPSALYGTLASFEAPSRLVAPGAEPGALSALEGRLGDVAPLLVEIYRLAVPEGEQDSRLHYTYLGFRDGLYACYPAVQLEVEGYDHRARPWYRAGVEAPSATWGEPYPDAAGSAYLLPCVMRMEREDGELLGVAGVSVTLENVLEGLKVESVEQLERVRLVDRRGNVLIDSGQRTSDLDAGSTGFELMDTRPLDSVDLAEALGGDEPAGFLVLDGEVHSWADFEAMPWTLLVTVDAGYLP